MEEGFGAGIGTGLYMEWMVNQDLLCSTGNSNQHSVITYRGKDLKKKKSGCTIQLNHVVAQQKLSHVVNQLYINATLENEKNSSFNNPVLRTV